MRVSTPYIGAVDDRVVRWGDGALSRYELETRRRRVSPISLAKAPHHRAAWMNLLLDYCPESLELLIDKCDRCSRPLGWTAAWGIGNCDDRQCGPLPESLERLAPELTEGYRMFAALASPVPGDNRAFVEGLATELRVLLPVTMIDFAVRLGAALAGITAGTRNTVRALAPAQKARVVSLGARMLLDWPSTLRRTVRDQIDSTPGRDGNARRRFRNALLRAAAAQQGGDSVDALLRGALPEIYVEVGRAFSGLTVPTILGSAAANRLGVNNSELTAATQAGVFTEETAFRGINRRVQYRLSEIECAEAAWRGSVPIETVASTLGLPRYACERMVASGAIEHEQHAFVLRLPGQPRATSGSLESFLDQLAAVCSRARPPAQAARLHAAMRVVGGRLKPWPQVLDAILNQKLPCWITPGALPITARMHVLPNDLLRFARLKIGSDVPVGCFIAADMSQIDAMSVLNLRQIDGPRLVNHGALRFRKGRRSFLVGVSEVLALAADHVATPEAAARLGIPPSAAHPLIVRVIGPTHSPAGWPRHIFNQTFGRKL